MADFIYRNGELMHYGVLGMKWGVRRSRPSSGGSKPTSKKGKTDDASDPKKTVKAESKPKKRKISELSDEELRQKISRLQMEKQYRDLAKNRETMNKGKNFTSDFLKAAGKKIVLDNAVDIISQISKHYMAKAGNNFIGDKNENGETIERVFSNNKKKS